MPYDRALMKRGEVARRLIAEGEDPFRMLAAVVWPGRYRSDDVLRERLVAYPRYSDDTQCDEGGSTYQ